MEPGGRSKRQVSRRRQALELRVPRPYPQPARSAFLGAPGRACRGDRLGPDPRPAPLEPGVRPDRGRRRVRAPPVGPARPPFRLRQGRRARLRPGRASDPGGRWRDRSGDRGVGQPVPGRKPGVEQGRARRVRVPQGFCRGRAGQDPGRAQQPAGGGLGRRRRGQHRRRESGGRAAPGVHRAGDGRPRQRLRRPVDVSFLAARRGGTAGRGGASGPGPRRRDGHPGRPGLAGRRADAPGLGQRRPPGPGRGPFGRGRDGDPGRDRPEAARSRPGADRGPVPGNRGQVAGADLAGRRVGLVRLLQRNLAGLPGADPGRGGRRRLDPRRPPRRPRPLPGHPPRGPGAARNLRDRVSPLPRRRPGPLGHRAGGPL